MISEVRSSCTQPQEKRDKDVNSECEDGRIAKINIYIILIPSYLPGNNLLSRKPSFQFKINVFWGVVSFT